MNFTDAVKKVTGPMARRIMLMVARGVIRAVQQELIQGELLSGEVRDEMPLFQHYGFCSRPKPGAEMVSVFLGGNREEGIVIATKDGRYTFNLEEGEVAVFTDEGDSVHFKRGNVIKVKAQTKLEIESPEVELSGKLKVTGDIETTAGDVKAGIISLKLHKHGGVLSGNSATGPAQV